MDMIKELKGLALGSRMKRLLDRMNRDISGTYRSLGLDFEARWFSVFYLLKEEAPLTVTGIANRLGFSHPAVIKIAREMGRKGLLLSSQDKTDRRKRLLRLSRKGKETADRLSPVWEDIRSVIQELLDGADHHLLLAIEGMEHQLDEKELSERLFERMKPHLPEDIEILDYQPAYKKKFASLNEAWLKKHFRKDPHDRDLLADPYKKIIRPGGAVLFARLRGRIVGTCALLKHAENVFELSKMAVSEEARRRLVGTRLTLAVIEKAEAMGARALYLETHPSFVSARRLYEGLGFREVASSPLPVRYRRRRLVMKLELRRSI
jgi:ribosomal protein S18 acetylase RimI-like enzyme